MHIGLSILVVPSVAIDYEYVFFLESLLLLLSQSSFSLSSPTLKRLRYQSLPLCFIQNTYTSTLAMSNFKKDSTPSKFLFLLSSFSFSFSCRINRASLNSPRQIIKPMLYSPPLINPLRNKNSIYLSPEVFVYFHITGFNEGQ